MKGFLYLAVILLRARNKIAAAKNEILAARNITVAWQKKAGVHNVFRQYYPADFN